LIAYSALYLPAHEKEATDAKFRSDDEVPMLADVALTSWDADDTIQASALDHHTQYTDLAPLPFSVPANAPPRPVTLHLQVQHPVTFAAHEIDTMYGSNDESSGSANVGPKAWPQVNSIIDHAIGVPGGVYHRQHPDLAPFPFFLSDAPAGQAWALDTAVIPSQHPGLAFPPVDLDLLNAQLDEMYPPT
jgi:hypothetical protein